MKARRLMVTAAVLLFTTAVSLQMLTALWGTAQPLPHAAAYESADDSSLAPERDLEAQALISLTFAGGESPWYAQDGIFLEPEVAEPGQPMRLCAEILNQDTVNPHSAGLIFKVGQFGIGVPLEPIGRRSGELPPGGAALHCVEWVPPQFGKYSLELELSQVGVEQTLVRQHNIDLFEPLQPGVPHQLVFPVGPLPGAGLVTFTADVRPGWEVAVSPSRFAAQPGVRQLVTLTTTAPDAVLLGDRGPIVDVEGFQNGVSIGGFRKLDTPPVLLHRAPDPFFAESEIHVWPYPPRAGEPTELCGQLLNISDQPQTVLVGFSTAEFGIGLPFTPLGRPLELLVPPRAAHAACTVWVPPATGHFDLQLVMEIVGSTAYHPQFSQRNLDVGQSATAGAPVVSHFRVGNFHNPFTNPEPAAADIWLETDLMLPGWRVTLEPELLPAVGVGESRMVTMTVLAPEVGPMPPGGTPVADIRALVDSGPGPRVIGGIRKIVGPPIILHRYQDPPYAEREITLQPYPARAGEPQEMCVQLFNPTAAPQPVVLRFSWANFGIGLPFRPIGEPVEQLIPPRSIQNSCQRWVPPAAGLLTVQVELFMERYPPQKSQRSIDIDEPLEANTPHQRVFRVANPFQEPVTITLGLVPHLPGWEFELYPDVLPAVLPGPQNARPVTLTVVPPADLPADRAPVVDVEAFVDGELIGGFRKIFRPPVPVHPFPDPVYAEREIMIQPYPPAAGEPTELCVELRNPTDAPRDVAVQFSWASFGIGLPFTPINGLRMVHLPPQSVVRECIYWIPPIGGQLCLQVELFMEGQAPQKSQRNLDVDEPLAPNAPHSRTFLVGNPTDGPVTITLGLVPHLPDWGLEIYPDTLLDVQPGPQNARAVTLTVTPPNDLPEDGQPIVDVEAYIDGSLLGGFRKLFRPGVPIHRPRDPVYAESEIFVHPYPPRAREPMEIGVEVRNPTLEPQTVTITFSAAEFGIGLPFTPIHPPLVLTLPPGGLEHPAIIWVPPHEGLYCFQVEIEMAGHRRIYFSQRNMDVGEPLEPLIPHSRPFPVGNPTSGPLTITLGLVPHLPGWGLELSQDVLPNILPGEVREVILTVTPPEELPPDGRPIVDVEAFAQGQLIGGFRKIFRPPVPIHRPRDPIYAESEIGIDPYPLVAGQPAQLSVELFNPTDTDRVITATFSVARFGIGLPFSTADIIPNPIRIFVPAHGAARGHVIWRPPHWIGKVCVRVELEIPGSEPIWSQRNIDVGEPLVPGQPHALVFPVGNWPYTRPVTVHLGLINHREDWDISLSQTELTAVSGSSPLTVTLTVTPPLGTRLGLGEPIVDVEAFVDGQILGGFRKMDVPPVPIHKPHEKGYAESEIRIDPYPPRQGRDSVISTDLQNNSDLTMTVEIEYGWAQFGMGIPFNTAGMDPITASVRLAPGMTRTVESTWTPQRSGSQCVQIRLKSAGYEDQVSQRNVHVEERPPCGETRVFTFTVYNNSPLTAVVDVGMISFNVPADWQITVVPSDTLTLPPFSEGVVTVTVKIPCPGTRQARLASEDIAAIQAEAGSMPLIDVEGYIAGELVGGIELLFEAAGPEPGRVIYLPVLFKN